MDDDELLGYKPNSTVPIYRSDIETAKIAALLGYKRAIELLRLGREAKSPDLRRELVKKADKLKREADLLAKHASELKEYVRQWTN